MWVRERGVAAGFGPRTREGGHPAGGVSALECETLVRGIARLLLAAVIAGLGASESIPDSRGMRGGRSWVLAWR